MRTVLIGVLYYGDIVPQLLSGESRLRGEYSFSEEESIRTPFRPEPTGWCRIPLRHWSNLWKSKSLRSDIEVEGLKYRTDAEQKLPVIEAHGSGLMWFWMLFSLV